jgi:DNA (cytosine-5)-methyltransferase 1
MRTQPLTFCEFFAGIGLVRAGLEACGWSCTYANDIDPKKAAAYRARFPTPDHFHLADVRDTGAITERIARRPALATASFPCVDLSLAGHYRGLAASSSSTFFAFVDVLTALGPERPPLVLLENVPGLLTSRGGADFAEVARRLAELGYWLDAFLLDAAHFTPQSRPRVFVVAALPELKPEEECRGTLWPVEPESALRTPTIRRLRASIELSTG